jgi:hypothetical protein
MFTDTSADTHVKGYGAGGVMLRGAKITSRSSQPLHKKLHKGLPKVST